MATNRPPFLPGITYHVFNRTNNSELLFKEEKHYQFFLRRFKELVGPSVNVLAYCLMPTHFHFLLTVMRPEELGASDPGGTGDIPVQERRITATGQELVRLAATTTL